MDFDLRLQQCEEVKPNKPFYTLVRAVSANFDDEVSVCEGKPKKPLTTISDSVPYVVAISYNISCDP